MADYIYKRKLGDRKEGRLLRSIPEMTKLIPFIMKNRNDATNLFEDSVEVTNIDKWIRQKRKEGYKGLGMLHVVLAAYIRTIAERPALNRFVSGQKIYARHNVEVVFTVKHAMTDDAEESSVKVKFSQTDTVFDVYDKISRELDELMASEDGNDTDAFIRTVTKLPRFLLNGVFGIIRMMDYYGIVPQSLLNISPFHGSFIITDLGSLGIQPIYHHIYNFGNLPVFIAFGSKRKVQEISYEGKLVERKYMDMKMTCDERICDGFYFAASFKYLKHFIENPELLEAPPERVVQDVY